MPIFTYSENMTNKKNDEVVEVDGEKGEKPENVVVHVHKDGAAKIEKLKKTLISKKSTSTRFINKLKEQAIKFKAATETDNRDNTSTTKTALRITANQVIEIRNKLMKYSSEVEALAEEISDVLIEFSASERRVMIKQLNSLGELRKFPRRVKRTRKRKQERE